MPAAIGVDIGGTHMRAGRIAADGSILDRRRTASSRDPGEALARLVELVAGLDAPDVAAIGVGVPGRVDFARQAVLSGGYVDLSAVPLVAELAGRVRTAGDDRQRRSMALVAEARLGAGRGVRNLALMFTIGTGIGGGVMDDGSILRGGGTAGQLGHIPVDPGGPPCLCGRRGCVETLSSGTALAGLIRDAGFPRRHHRRGADRAGEARRRPRPPRRARPGRRRSGVRPTPWWQRSTATASSSAAASAAKRRRP